MSDAPGRPGRIWAWDDRTPTERDKGWSACDAGTGSTEYIRADLAPAPSVIVKPLEWAHKPVPNKNCYIESATALGLEYEAYGGGAWAVNGSFHAVGADCARRIHSAKAAAQADYEARIMAAIQIGPRRATPETALREALERCREIALQSGAAPLSMGEIVKRVDVALGEDTDLPGWMLTLAPGWQPIETAPSEARILVYVPRYGVTTAHKGTDFSGDSRFMCHSILNKEAQPTHWMPLPAPPSEGVEP